MSTTDHEPFQDSLFSPEELSPAEQDSIDNTEMQPSEITPVDTSTDTEATPLDNPRLTETAPNAPTRRPNKRALTIAGASSGMLAAFVAFAAIENSKNSDTRPVSAATTNPNTEATPSPSVTEAPAPSPTDLPSATSMAPSPTATAETPTASTTTTAETGVGSDALPLTKTFAEKAVSSTELADLENQYPDLADYVSDKTLTHFIVAAGLNKQSMLAYKALTQKYYKDPAISNALGSTVTFNPAYVKSLEDGGVSPSDMLGLSNDQLLNAAGNAPAVKLVGYNAYKLAFLNPDNRANAIQGAQAAAAQNRSLGNPEARKHTVLRVVELPIDGVQTTFVALLSEYPTTNLGPAYQNFDWLVGIDVGAGINPGDTDSVVFPSLGEESHITKN